MQIYDYFSIQQKLFDIFATRMKILLGYTPTDIDFMRILHLFEKEFTHILPPVVWALGSLTL